jgi:putative ABC transport system permease protein
MIPIFAWRNMWRNKLRSAVIILAVTTGTFAGIFLIAFSKGIVNSRVEAVISTEISHIQIHKPGFTDNDQFSLRFMADDSLMSRILHTPHVVAASKRIIVNSMVASAETGIGVKINGIDPQQEQRVTRLHTKIIQGEYLAETGRYPVVISEKLAQKLKVGLHNKIVITVQDEEKNITGGAFRIAGIYRTDNLMFDEANIFVRNSDIARLTGIPDNEVHEVALLLDDNRNTEATSQLLSARFPELEMKNWLQISPDAGALVGAMNQYTYIFNIIILLALSFGIVNTMLMVIMERLRELGMLMAIGMNRMRVFMMIMLETIFLSLTGGVLGVAAGWSLSLYTGRKGINLYFWKEAFGEMGFSSLVYPVAETQVILVTTLMVVAAGIISALYPATKAIRLKPARAIRSL